MAEFALIERHFAACSTRRDDVVVGIGDDAAIVRVAPDHDLAYAAATLSAANSGIGLDRPESLGHSLLSTALNRLSAMGAKPAWLTLAVTLANADDDWLTAFCQGYGALAVEHELELIGGDTTSGPLTVTTVATGYTGRGQQRSIAGARPGDHLVLTGEIGHAALATLCSAMPERFPAALREAAIERYAMPRPRTDAAALVAEFAHAAVDLSAGLTTALKTMLSASRVGANIDITRVPTSDATRATLSEMNLSQRLLDNAGDHELCLSVAPERLPALMTHRTSALPLVDIGVVQSRPGLRFQQAATDPIA